MIAKRRSIAVSIAALALTAGLTTNASAHLSWFLPSSTGSTSSLSCTLLGSILGGATATKAPTTKAPTTTKTTTTKATTSTPTPTPTGAAVSTS